MSLSPNSLHCHPEFRYQGDNFLLNSPGFVSAATSLVLGTALPQRNVSLEETEYQRAADGEGAQIFSCMYNSHGRNS